MPFYRSRSPLVRVWNPAARRVSCRRAPGGPLGEPPCTSRFAAAQGARGSPGRPSFLCRFSPSVFALLASVSAYSLSVVGTKLHLGPSVPAWWTCRSCCCSVSSRLRFRGLRARAYGSLFLIPGFICRRAFQGLSLPLAQGTLEDDCSVNSSSSSSSKGNSSSCGSIVEARVGPQWGLTGFALNAAVDLLAPLIWRTDMSGDICSEEPKAKA